MSVWSGTRGNATQQAEAPCRPALPQFPHNTAACQLTSASTEGAPSWEWPQLLGHPQRGGMQAWAGSHVLPKAEHWQAEEQVSPGVTGRQLEPYQLYKPVSLPQSSDKAEKREFSHSQPPKVAPVARVEPEQLHQVASARCLLCRLGWELGLFAKGRWQGHRM